MRSLCDCHGAAVWQQHPDWNLQALTAVVYDTDSTVCPFRSADNLEDRVMQGMEGIENLDVRRFCAQGIVGADASIRMSTVSFQPVVWLPTGADGFHLSRASFCLWPC